MKLWPVRLITMLLIAFGCSMLFLTRWNITSLQQENLRIDEDEYEVYRIIIKSMIGRGWVILRNYTEEGEIFKDEAIRSRVLREMPELKRETLKNFYLKNRFPTFLNKKILRKFKINFELISNEEFEEIFKEDADEGWKVFYTKYPGSRGIMTISRVGFDKGKRQAFVYVTHTSGSLCGYGVYILLTKRKFLWKTIWVIQRKVVAWVS